MPKCPILTLVCALALGGCSKDTSTEMVFDPTVGSPDAGSGPATFTLVRTQVLAPSCAIAGCHAGSAYPNLSADRAYTNLVGAPSSTGGLQVTAGDPDASYLMTKLTGGPGMEGDRMPQGGAPLDSTRVALVRAWIERGAPQD